MVDRLSLARLDPTGHVYTVGGGTVTDNAPSGLPGVRLTVGPTEDDRYADAQIDDYHVDGRLRWRPPLRLSVRARFSEGAERLRGTAGFGFWNDPLGMTGRRRWRLPKAAWFFFGGAETEIQLKQGVKGRGWKATTIDAGQPLVPVLLPLAPLAAWLMRSAWWYRRLWPMAEQLLGVNELEIDVEMDAWHDYALVWRQETVTFIVDGQTLLATSGAPYGPLGLVIWIDNQFMVATPQGRFAQGVVRIDRQWLELAALDVSPLG